MTMKEEKKIYFDRMRFFLQAFFCLLLLQSVVGTQTVRAQTENKQVQTNVIQQASAQEKEIEIEDEAFDAGKMILEHVTDKHSWEICKVGKRELVVHLPVILYHENSLYVFSSGRFNPEGRYDQFQLREEEPYKGKVVAWQTNDAGQYIINPNLPLDFSITKNVFGIMVSAILLLLAFFIVSRHYKKNGCSAPKGLAALIEPIFLFVRDDVVYSNLGKKQGDRFLPYLLTLFFFILFVNIFGLIPIFPFGANLTGNIAVTLTLAGFTFITTLAFSGKEYWKEIFNPEGVPWWMKFPIPLIPLIEFIEIFTKPIVLMIRLFANVIAGHIVILGFVALIFIFGTFSLSLGLAVSPVTIVFGLFVDVLEILVSFIQAYIFSMLSAIYIAGAVGYKDSKEPQKKLKESFKKTTL